MDVISIAIKIKKQLQLHIFYKTKCPKVKPEIIIMDDVVGFEKLNNNYKKSNPGRRKKVPKDDN